VTASVFSARPYATKKTFRIQAVGLEFLEKAPERLRADRLRRGHQEAQGGEIDAGQGGFRYPARTQAVFVGEIRRRRSGGSLFCDRFEPERRALDEGGRRKAVGGAAAQHNVNVVSEQPHVMMLRQPGDRHGHRVVNHQAAVALDILRRNHDPLRAAGGAGCVLQKEDFGRRTHRRERCRLGQLFGHQPADPHHPFQIHRDGAAAVRDSVTTQQFVKLFIGQ